MGLSRCNAAYNPPKPPPRTRTRILSGIVLLLGERTKKPRKDQSGHQTDERTKQREPKRYVETRPRKWCVIASFHEAERRLAISFLVLDRGRIYFYLQRRRPSLVLLNERSPDSAKAHS